MMTYEQLKEAVRPYTPDELRAKAIANRELRIEQEANQALNMTSPDDEPSVPEGAEVTVAVIHHFAKERWFTRYVGNSTVEDITVGYLLQGTPVGNNRLNYCFELAEARGFNPSLAITGVNHRKIGV